MDQASPGPVTIQAECLAVQIIGRLNLWIRISNDGKNEFPEDCFTTAEIPKKIITESLNKL